MTLTLDRLPTRIAQRITVDPSTGCWLWDNPDCHGYGAVDFEGRWQRIHRVTYFLLVGDITEETLDHLCRVRHCVNPIHLDPVTVRENTLRGVGLAAQNARKALCLNGHPYDRVDRRGQRVCYTCQRARNRVKALALTPSPRPGGEP